jgi:hypothetical protein
MYRELPAMGAKPDHAGRLAANSRCWWRNSGTALNAVLTTRWLADLGACHSLEPLRLEPPGADPHAGLCGRGAILKDRPLCRFVGPGQQNCAARRRRRAGAAFAVDPSTRSVSAVQGN